jgi:branched-chain amino acid transport system permease protein
MTAPSETPADVGPAVLGRARTALKLVARASRMSRGLRLLGGASVLLVLVFPLVAIPLGLDYYVGFVRRIMITVLAAAGLNFMMGYCGMVAIGYAGFIGVGAYCLVALSDMGVTSAWICWMTAALVAGVAGLLIGSISLRAKGVYFIMITLAFAQMLYYVAISLRKYGGDDGYTLTVRPALGFGLDSMDDATLYWVFLTIDLAAFWLLHRVGRSRFGAAMLGIRDNETRMQAIGYPVYRLKLVAFAGTAAIAGLSGAMLGVNNGFVSPTLMQTTQSLTLMVMVAIGGLGRHWGGPLGAALWMVLQEVLQTETEYWRWPLGLMLILAVFVVPRGIAGLAATSERRP